MIDQGCNIPLVVPVSNSHHLSIATMLKISLSFLPNLLRSIYIVLVGIVTPETRQQWPGHENVASKFSEKACLRDVRRMTLGGKRSNCANSEPGLGEENYVAAYYIRKTNGCPA